MTVWDDRRGLPTNTVLNVAQDGVGYIWIASYDGLIRFDGSSFTVFSKADGRGFAAESARKLEVAPDGSLWIGTNDDGVYHYEGGRFSRFGQAEGLGDLSSRALGLDGEGALWVGTAKGVYRLASGRFEAVPAAEGQGYGISTFFVDLPGEGMLTASNFPGLWIARPEGIARWATPPELAGLSFSAAALDPEGVLWLGSSNGIVFRVAKGRVLERRATDPEESASVNAIYRQSDGSMRIATDKGLVSYKEGHWTTFKAEDGLPNDVVSSLCEDREGNLWLGTERGGLAKVSVAKFLSIGKSDGLVDDAVNAVAEDGYGSLWVATDKGVSFHPAAADPIASDSARKRAVESLVAGLKGVRVRQIRLARDLSLWFSTYSEKSVIRFDGSASTYYGKRDGLPSERARMSYEASDGSVLVGTTAGLALIAGGKIAAIGPAQGMPNHYAMDVAEEGGRILVATDGGGVAVLDKGRVAFLVDKSAGLAGNVVFRFVRDSGGRLWVCTAEGLSLWQGGRPAGSIDSRKGLPWNAVFQILEAEPGLLWLISSKGVAAISAGELEAAARSATGRVKARIIDKRDGLAGQLSANAWACVGKKGVLYLPTLGGVSVYDPSRSVKNAVPPPADIESVEVDGREAAVGPGGLKLAAGTGRVTFRFSALSYVEPSKVGCRYRLEGYDSDWIDAGPERSVSYTNLGPGNYAFAVSALNDDGLPSARAARLSLSKAPYAWQSPFFYVVIAAFLVASGFLASYLRLRKVEKRRRELEDLVKQRTRDLEGEKATSEALLLNILPARVAEELKRTGSSSPQLYSDVTVMFADLVGFTEACSSLAPERAIEELNRLFTAFDDIVLSRGGERIKTIGDAYLAASGMDGRDPEHSYAMCLAARDIMRMLDEAEGSSEIPWQLRIGLHCGPIVGGVVGVRKYVFDIFGDTVNTASRLQTNSVPTGICVSRAVADRVRSRLPIVDRPSRAVKGKGELPMSYIAWRRDLPSSEDSLLLESARSMYEAGVGDYKRGSYEAALALFSKIDLSLMEPESGLRIWKAIGACDRALGDRKGAFNAWRRALAYAIPDPELEGLLASEVGA
jgi:Predicted periplasmic ligand-binding sensor domain